MKNKLLKGLIDAAFPTIRLILGSSLIIKALWINDFKTQVLFLLTGIILLMCKRINIDSLVKMIGALFKNT